MLFVIVAGHLTFYYLSPHIHLKKKKPKHYKNAPALNQSFPTVAKQTGTKQNMPTLCARS